MKESSPFLQTPRWLGRLRAWLFRRQTLRFALVAAGTLLTLIAVFYTEENWRGKRAWEHLKAELEAKGQEFNWNAYIPKPVPDDENIFKAPKMSSWFVGRGSTELSRRVNIEGLSQSVRQHNAIAELKVIASEAKIATGDADLVIDFDPAATNAGPKIESKEITQLLTRVADQNASTLQGPSLKGPQLVTFYGGPTNGIKPVRILVRANRKLTAAEAGNLCSASTVGSGRWKVEAGANGTYVVCLGAQPGYAAADYLAWSDQFESEFNTIREAVKRPYALMPGDYSKAFAMPIPNFVAVRATAQTLAGRAQCHLLLNQPEEALRDLTLIHDLRGLMEAKPTGKPMTLVAAMINVAVAGLYADTIADGFRLHAWREPQLIALQKQLDEINLLGPVKEALATEPAALCQMIENTRPEEIQKIFTAKKNTGLKKFTDPTYVLFAIAPRGWRYQNIATIARVQQPTIEIIDLEHNLINPRKSVEATHAIVQVVDHGFRPYTLMAAIAVPNYTRAAMVLAYNQTKSHEALVACALERYHVAHGDYPESLDALTSQYLEKVPVELIGGQPLKYRRVDAGKFALYSIGWNERDDGGSPSPEVKGGQTKYDQGDWVWSAGKD